MKCPNCGKEIADDSIFCEYCGAMINAADDSSEKNKKIKWPQLIFGILLFVPGCYFVVHSGGIMSLFMLLALVGIFIFLAYKN